MYHHLHFIGHSRDETGSPGSTSVLFLNVFWNRSFVISGRVFVRPIPYLSPNHQCQNVVYINAYTLLLVLNVQYCIKPIQVWPKNSIQHPNTDTLVTPSKNKNKIYMSSVSAITKEKLNIFSKII